MRLRLLIVRLALVGLTAGLTFVASANNSSNATTAQNFEQQKLPFLQQQAKKANNNTNIPIDHPIGSVTSTTTTSSPYEFQGPAAYPFISATINQTTAWMWGRYPGSSAQDLVSGVLVVSGSVPNNPIEGEIEVWVTNIPPTSWQGQFVAPGQTGPISIQSIQGKIATWTSTSAEQGTFNIVTHVWTLQTPGKS